jgi:hypothetical protein
VRNDVDRQNRFQVTRPVTKLDVRAFPTGGVYSSGLSIELMSKMRGWATRRAKVPLSSRVFYCFVGQLFALAIVLWIMSALADPLTLRVAEASPGYTPGPSIIIRLDNDGRQAFAQFTTQHVGENIEFLKGGRVLMRARLRTPVLNGIITFMGVFGADEITDVANRLATDGRIEVNALGPPRQ